jgi:hypothetical protein
MGLVFGEWMEKRLPVPEPDAASETAATWFDPMTGLE